MRQALHIQIPEFALILLMGTSGAGKSSLARKHFRATEIISSDNCRAMVCDDENDQTVTADAFEVLHVIASKRLKRGKRTVIDATNLRFKARKPFFEIAKQYHCPVIAIVLDLPLKISLERNTTRTDRCLSENIITQQFIQLKESLISLEREGFKKIFIFNKTSELEDFEFVFQPNPSNQQSQSGPFDLIGDIHGCYDELLELLLTLGYQFSHINNEFKISHLGTRKLIFLGDLVDRGPKIPEVLRLVMAVVNSGMGFCILGNHDAKLIRALQGRQVNLTHGLAESMHQLEAEEKGFKQKIIDFLLARANHFVLDGGKLVVSHAGLREEMHGRESEKIHHFCIYGEPTIEKDRFGLPVRKNWAEEYRGRALVVYGHTPVVEPKWVNNTLCIDTGCVFGGRLTAWRYPENTLVSVPALSKYYSRPDYLLK
jgi:protein phosphatase